MIDSLCLVTKYKKFTFTFWHLQDAFTHLIKINSGYVNEICELRLQFFDLAQSDIHLLMFFPHHIFIFIWEMKCVTLALGITNDIGNKNIWNVLVKMYINWFGGKNQFSVVLGQILTILEIYVAYF